MSFKRIWTKKHLNNQQNSGQRNVIKASIQKKKKQRDFYGCLKDEKDDDLLRSRFNFILANISSKISARVSEDCKNQHPIDEEALFQKIKTRLAFLAILWPTTVPRLTDEKHCDLLYQAAEFYGIEIEETHNNLLLRMSEAFNIYDDFMIPVPNRVFFEYSALDNACSTPIDKISEKLPVQKNGSSSSSNWTKGSKFSDNTLLGKRLGCIELLEGITYSGESNGLTTSSKLVGGRYRKDRLMESVCDIYGNKSQSVRRSDFMGEDDSTCVEDSWFQELLGKRDFNF
jgi:hypothetical protein